MGSAQPPRLVVLGIDGGSWDQIGPLLDAGDLPAFAALLEEGGSRAPLQSVVPPLTAPAWQSIFTGCEVGEHGLFEMTVYDPSIGRRRPLSLGDWQATPLWERVAARGLTGGYLGIPFTYPTPEVDGWFVSGIMGTPTYGERMFWPRDLFPQVTRVAGEYGLQALERREGRYPVEALDRQIEWIHSATMHLLRERPVDVCVVVESYTDFVQHFFLGSRMHEREGAVVDMVRHAYRAADRLLGEIRAHVGADVPVVVLSDHGFAPLAGYVNATRLAASLSKSGEAREQRAESLFRGLKRLWRATGKAALRALGVDPARLSQWGVRALQRTGDEPDAVVIGHYGSVWLTGDPSASGEEDIEKALDALSAMRGPDGEALFEARHARRSYGGAHPEQSPHVLLQPNRPHYEFRRAAPGSPLLFDREEGLRAGIERCETEGTHAPSGIWMASAAAQRAPVPARLPEVQASLLALLGEGEPGQAPGAPAEPVARPTSYSPEEERALLDQLRSLGYID